VLRFFRMSGAIHPAGKLAVFVAVTAAALGAAAPAAGLAGTLLPGGSGQSTHAAIVGLLLLTATWVCLRLEGKSLRDLGLAGSRRTIRDCAAGFGLGAALFALIALAQGAMVSAAWSMHPAASLGAAASGLSAALLLLLPEELVFRGYAFRQLERISGRSGALLLSAASFGAYHLYGSGDWAIGAFFRFAMPFLGGLIFGYALLRSGGLALPIGLHWGGNWVQASLFGVNNTTGPPSVWTTTLNPAGLHSLTAPDLLPHLPYLLALGSLVVVVRRWSDAPDYPAGRVSSGARHLPPPPA